MVMPKVEIKIPPKKPLKDLLVEYFKNEQYDDYLKLAYENRIELIKEKALDSDQLFVAALKSASAALLVMTSRLSVLLKPNELLGIYYQHRHDQQFNKTIVDVKKVPINIWLPILIAQDNSLLNYIKKSANLLLICKLQYKQLAGVFAAKKERVPEMPAELLQSMKGAEKLKEAEPAAEVAPPSAARSDGPIAISPFVASANQPSQFFEKKPKDPLQDKRAAVDFLVQEPGVADSAKYVEVAYQWRAFLIQPGEGDAPLRTIINPEFLEKAALDNVSSANKVLSSSALCFILAPQVIKDILTKHQLDAKSFPAHVSKAVASLEQASSSMPAPK